MRKISLIVEGASEEIFLDSVRNFLRPQCPAGAMPKLVARPMNSNIPPSPKLIKMVRALLQDGSNHVIILTDVKGPNKFKDAQDAIAQIESSLGGLPSLNNQVFVHAAQYEIEAWLIPFWPRIQALAQSQRSKPTKAPEQINNQKPPSRLLGEIWRTGSRKSKSYNKVSHLPKILEGQDLEHASKECPTLKLFLNRLLTLSGAKTL